MTRRPSARSLPHRVPDHGLRQHLVRFPPRRVHPGREVAAQSFLERQQERITDRRVVRRGHAVLGVPPSQQRDLGEELVGAVENPHDLAQHVGELLRLHRWRYVAEQAMGGRGDLKEVPIEGERQLHPGVIHPGPAFAY